jgi:tRNA pseudouridine55 synthase
LLSSTTAPVRPAGTRTTDGLLLVDKPAGVTSHDAVAVVRRATRERRIGHAGTLDPFATGLLVMLLGRGTRLVDHLDGEPKVYLATIRFGAETDTDDHTGTVTRTAPPPARDAVLPATRFLTGALDQVPPAYSAKKVDGERAYDAARRGVPRELAPARVHVHSWEVLTQTPDTVDVRIVCGGGTYVRALARDLGRLTESAAHLASLRRTTAGAFDVRDAASLDRIETGDFSLRPLTAAIPSLPRQLIAAENLRRVLHGNTIPATVDGLRVALVDADGELIAIALRVGDQLQPKVVLKDA